MNKTQHIIGGFGKTPGDPPDLYHGYLGIAALATMGEPTLKDFDAAFCVSTETVRKMARARAGLLAAVERERRSEQRDAFWDGQRRPQGNATKQAQVEAENVYKALKAEAERIGVTAP